MFFIRQGATHKVVIGPVVAVANGYVPVTTLALNTADEAEVILHDNGTVVDISAYTFAAITTADGYYHLTLQSGISNTVGHMTVVINDDSLCLPVKAEFTVVEEAVYDAFYAASAPGYVTNQPVDVNTIKTQTVTCGAGVTVLASVGTAATSTAQTGDSYALANGANGFVAIKGDTAAILADTGTDGVVVAAGSKTGYSLTATTGLGNQTANITGNLSGSVGSVTGAVGSVTGAVGSVTSAVTVGTNNDKTGYSLTDSPGIKKNAALAAFQFLMVDSADHVTPKTGLTITATRSLDGAAFAACANAVAELSNGIYNINLAAGDLNGTVVTLRFTATGADDRLITIVTET